MAKEEQRPADSDSKNGSKSAPANESIDSIIVDLGSHSRKKIKRLRKGQGSLMDEVDDSISELKASGAIDESAQPIVIVVKEKPKKRTQLPYLWA